MKPQAGCEARREVGGRRREGGRERRRLGRLHLKGCKGQEARH